MLTESNGIVRYRDPAAPAALRAVVGLIGIGHVIGLPALVFFSSDGTQSIWGTLLTMAFVCLFVSLGAAIVFIALKSTHELELNPNAQVATRTRRGPIINDQASFPLSALTAPKLVLRSSEDGPFAVLQMQLPDGKPLEMAPFATPAEAEGWQRRITRLLAQRA